MRTEQSRIMRDLEAHQTANRSYIEEDVQLLELAQRRARQVGESAASGKTQSPEFCTLEPHVKLQRTHREISATLLTCWELRSHRKSSGWERE